MPAACETAAAAAGKAYRGSETEPSSPSGCYVYLDADGFYFNADAVGAGKPGTELLCAVTTGAPLHAPMRRRAWAAQYSRAVCLIIQVA